MNIFIDAKVSMDVFIDGKESIEVFMYANIYIKVFLYVKVSIIVIIDAKVSIEVFILMNTETPMVFLACVYRGVDVASSIEPSSSFLCHLSIVCFTVSLQPRALPTVIVLLF